jgi:hypothetical protein
MTKRFQTRDRKSERGEGNLKFIIYLAVLGLAGYLGIVNVPKFFSMQSLKSDVADLARTRGLQGIAAEKVRKRADELARRYDIPPQDIKIQQDGRGIQVTLNTVQKIDLIVTDYDWVINETTKVQPY